MGVEAYVPGRDYHKIQSLCSSSPVERKLERQGSVFLWPGAEDCSK